MADSAVDVTDGAWVVYLGGAYFFLRVTRACQWHTVAGGFIPVGTFASLMGLTTILHWDRFIHSNLAFWLWVALYFTTPFAVFAVFLRNHGEYDSGHDELRIGNVAAYAIVTAGTASALTAAFLYLFPSQAIHVWPWHLTPLTARMLAAIFALGVAGIGAARERRWSAAKILFQVEGFMLGLIFVAGVRARAEFNASRLLTWLFVVGFAATAAATLGLYIRMELKARSIVAHEK